jgi:hypothetical protein
LNFKKSKIASSKMLVLVVLPVILLGATAIAHALFVGNATTQDNINPLPTQSSFAPTINTMRASTNANHLQLILSLNATQIKSGDAINITVSDINSLQTANAVNGANLWTISALTQWGCPDRPPVGIAVFKGYYTSQNISSAKELQIVLPGAWACPNIDYSQMTFQPGSDQISVVAPRGLSFPLVMTMPLHGNYSETTAQYEKSGYNPNSTAVAPPTIIPFTTGTYTVAGGDEWGSLVLLYFEVA